MAYDEHLADAVRLATAKRPEITEKKMFGGICFMLNGNMLCGIEVGRYMFRVGKDQEAEALAKPGCSKMDLTGRPMGGLVWVAEEDCQDTALEAWLAMAETFVGSLPPKKPKQKKGTPS